MTIIDYLNSIKPYLSNHPWINAFIFGSSIKNNESTDIDVCLILDHNETSVVAHIQKLLSLFEIFCSKKRNFAITPTFELTSFALPRLDSSSLLHLLVYPDLWIYNNCESMALKKNIQKNHCVLVGDTSILFKMEYPVNPILENFWDILIKIINSLVLLLNQPPYINELHVLHARKVLLYANKWLFGLKTTDVSKLETIGDIICAYKRILDELTNK